MLQEGNDRTITPQKLDPRYEGDTWYPVTHRRLIQENGKYYLVGRHGGRYTAKGEYNFVTINGHTYVAKPSTAGHFDISQGALQVDCACTIRFGYSAGTRGAIREWANNSAHYQPSPDFAWQSGLPVELFKRH
ncbi:hypothetical protein OLMES_3299 [Oleiphilus messinensis]|uniref:Uncharacterized protein n=1 Tax=Oleiphilus messinensis TaxID=141451 RepID=A0A1Y0IAR2_9GAMM|nr:hypothetical protein [Oleiphilus messinensis]ARU57340.1 hypothetical protein OLMES_3299 [Oleiphilus messinensis]